MAEHRTGSIKQKIEEKNEAKIAIEVGIITESRGSKHLKGDMPVKGMRVGVDESRVASARSLLGAGIVKIQATLGSLIDERLTVLQAELIAGEVRMAES
jgi:hypothetical protein